MTIMRRDYKKTYRESRAACAKRHRMRGPALAKRRAPSTDVGRAAALSATRPPVDQRLGQRAGHGPAEVDPGQLQDLPLLPALVGAVGRGVRREGAGQVIGFEGEQE